MTEKSILDLTLEAAVRDAQTVRDGAEIVPLLDGMSFRESVIITDDRGTLTEMFDPRWGWHDAPLVYAYNCTILPGGVKGWALH